MLGKSTEVVIIGAGVIGCSIAYHLCKQGVKPLVIEKDAIASQGSGKAWATLSSIPMSLLLEGAKLAPPANTKSAIAYLGNCCRRFPKLAAELKEETNIDIGLGHLTQMRICCDEGEEEYLRELEFDFERQGYEVGWLIEQDLHILFPDIAPGVRSALYWPCIQMEPYEYTLALAQAAENMGATIKNGTAVGFRNRRQRVTAMISATREIEADIFVLAMGPWTVQATSWLGKEMPGFRVVREQCLRLEVPKRLPPYRLQSNGVAIVPKVNGTVILGKSYSPKFSGVKAKGTVKIGPVPPPDFVDYDAWDSPTEETKFSLIKNAVELLPNLAEAKIKEHRSGLDGWHPDIGLAPVLGRLPGWDNVYIAGCGLVPFGIGLSPIIGQIMADLIIKGETEESQGFLNTAYFKARPSTPEAASRGL